MLKMPTVGGPGTLRLFLDDVPTKRHRELLGVGDRTIDRWLCGISPTPMAALQALYWHTRWGTSEIESQFGYENAFLRLQLSHQVGHVGGLFLCRPSNEAANRPLRVVSAPGREARISC